MCDKTTPEDARAIEDWLKTHKPTEGKTLLAFGARPELEERIGEALFDPHWMFDPLLASLTGPRTLADKKAQHYRIIARGRGGYRQRKGLQPMLAPGE